MEFEHILFPLFSLVIAVIGLLYQHFKVLGDLRKDLDRKIDTVDEKIYLACNRLSILETKMDLFWSNVEKIALNMLKHPHESERDSLIKKFEERTITLNELDRLKFLLELLLQQDSKSIEAYAAGIILARITGLTFEAKKVEEETQKRITQPLKELDGVRELWITKYLTKSKPKSKR